MRREKAAVLPGKKSKFKFDGRNRKISITVLQYNTILFWGSIRFVFLPGVAWILRESDSCCDRLRATILKSPAEFRDFSHRGHSPPAFAMSPSESPGKLGCRRGSCKVIQMFTMIGP